MGAAIFIVKESVAQGGDERGNALLIRRPHDLPERRFPLIVFNVLPHEVDNLRICFEW